MIDKLEDSLNGGYGGLFGEVVTEDIYRLKKLPFTPDIIFDFGANVGIFTRYARELFPHATIVAVEPDPKNIEVFERFTPMENVILIKKAIGAGTMWRKKNDLNGAHESYMSHAPGSRFDNLRADEVTDYEQTEVQSIMPEHIINFYMRSCPWCKAMLKMDIEGNENAVFVNHESMQAIFRMEYVAIELHRISIDEGEQTYVNWMTTNVTKRFGVKYDTDFDVKDTMFYAIKKEYGKVSMA